MEEHPTTDIDQWSSTIEESPRLGVFVARGVQVTTYFLPQGCAATASQKSDIAEQ
jgi:hypothetical protein